MMPRFLSVAVGIFSFAAFPLGVVAADQQSETKARGEPTAPAASELVQAALECELSGQSDRRASLLQEAVAKAPDAAPAHWHSGEVALDGKWLSVAQVQNQMRSDAKLAEYRRLREQATGTAADQAALARWCKRNKLTSEEQTHWRMVLEIEPNNQEAIKALGSQKFHGMLLTPGQISRAKSRAQAVAQAAEEFRPLVTKWRKATEKDDAGLRAEVAAKVQKIFEPAEMIGLERALWQQLGPREHQRIYQAISRELVALLGEMPQQAAVDSLVRHAVLSPFEEVRSAAAVALKKRPLDSYVPLLLSGMATPIEASVTFSTTPEGQVHRYCQLYREGAFTDLSVSWIAGVSYTGKTDLYLDNQSWLKGAAKDAPKRRKELIQGRAAALQESASLGQKVERTNQAIAARNARIQEVLTEATGIDKGDNPIQWWNWWVQDYNGYETPGSAEATPNNPYDDTNRGGKKKYEITYDFRSFGPRPSTVAMGSCFARGTQVPTLTGLMAIEDIKVGDRVLAEDADTGELAFKPVLAVTTRAPGPRIKIGIGEQALVATPGHPFWVVGQGWRMAKQLTTGTWLHGPAGSLEITSLENVEAPLPYHEVAYNLIVADFNTYFVGAEPVLVHDNTTRKPASTPVPGLARPIALASSP